MKVFVDSHLLPLLITADSEKNWEKLREKGIQRGFFTENQNLQILFGWPTLLEYLDLSSVFQHFFLFNEENPLFAFLISSLKAGGDDELLIRLFDQLFVECLTHVKALPQIDPLFLLDQIQKKQTHPQFSQTLSYYEKMLKENTAYIMHDLILYLAWDRVCVNMGVVFEQPHSEPAFQEGLKVLRTCLLESFQHIFSEGRTMPSFFRLLEALYAYEMREERLQKHLDVEWEMLCQSSSILKPRDQLTSVYYIDHALISLHSMIKKDFMVVMTADSENTVLAAQRLAHFMINKLIQKDHWNYRYEPINVIS